MGKSKSHVGRHRTRASHLILKSINEERLWQSYGCCCYFIIFDRRKKEFKNQPKQHHQQQATAVAPLSKCQLPNHVAGENYFRFFFTWYGNAHKISPYTIHCLTNHASYHT